MKLRLEYKANDQWTTALSANYFSKVYARGDENNQDSNGAISGYSVLGLDTSYKMDAGLEFFMQITNLLDEKYETMGILGENYFVNGTYSTTTQSEQFRGIGLPRAAFIGIKYSFGG